MIRLTENQMRAVSQSRFFGLISTSCRDLNGCSTAAWFDDDFVTTINVLSRKTLWIT